VTARGSTGAAGNHEACACAAPVNAIETASASHAHQALHAVAVSFTIFHSPLRFFPSATSGPSMQ
jgi:hypothetical protein